MIKYTRKGMMSFVGLEIGYMDVSSAADQKLRNFQMVELELFKKFVQFADEYNIRYYALGGTLLGAIRHKGFIPWDDDMDLGIPREDYDRLLELASEGKTPFKVRSFFNDPTYYRYFARAEDDSMKVVRNDNLTEEISSAWIDLFPLDGMPNNRLLRSIHEKYILYRRALYKLSCFSKGVNVNKKNRPFAERVLVKAGKVLPVEKIFHTGSQLRKLDRALKRFPYRSSDYLVNAMGAYKFREMFHKKYYGKGSWYDFEDTEVFGPDDYDFVLKQLYGDYMTPVNDNHHASEVI